MVIWLPHKNLLSTFCSPWIALGLVQSQEAVRSPLWLVNVGFGKPHANITAEGFCTVWGKVEHGALPVCGDRGEGISVGSEHRAKSVSMSGAQELGVEGGRGVSSFHQKDRTPKWPTAGI